MKRPLLLLALCLAPAVAHATFVQSSHTNYATAASTACATGTVTSGNVEVMAVQANSTTAVTISSTHVTTWIRDQATISGASVYIWHGAITSSGAETVTVSFTSGSATIGSACLEYSGTIYRDSTAVNASSSLSLTTVAAATTIIEVGISGGSIDTAAPFTHREQVSLTGTPFLAAGDVNESSQGTYSAAFSASPTTIVMLALTASAPPASVYIQSGLGSGLSGTSQTCVYPANVASGDLLIVGTKTNSPSVTSIADTLGTSWTTDSGGAGSQVGFYHGVAHSSGADTVTMTLGSSDFSIVICAEYATKTTLDVFVGPSGTSTSAPITTTKANTIVVLLSGAGPNLSLNGVTTRAIGVMATAPNGDLVLGDVNEAVAGTYTPTTSTASSNARASFYNSVVSVPRHR